MSSEQESAVESAAIGTALANVPGMDNNNAVLLAALAGSNKNITLHFSNHTTNVAAGATNVNGTTNVAAGATNINGTYNKELFRLRGLEPWRKSRTC